MCAHLRRALRARLLLFSYQLGGSIASFKHINLATDPSGNPSLEVRSKIVHFIATGLLQTQTEEPTQSLLMIVFALLALLGLIYGASSWKE